MTCRRRDRDKAEIGAFALGHGEYKSISNDVILFTLFKERPELLGRMVAAYAIGYSLTPDQLRANPHLRFATGRTDTGVIVAYNTEAPGYDGANPVLTPGALAINPVTWTRSEERAPAVAGVGARINGVDYPCLADAQVDIARGVIRCSTVDPEFFWKGEGLFKPGVFHAGDFPFYFHDLRKNAADRAAAFLEAR